MNDETRPSEEVTPPAPPEWSPPPAPPVAFEEGGGKRKIDVGMFLLGLATPFLVLAIVSAIATGVSDLLYGGTTGEPTPFVAGIGVVVGFLPMVLMLGTFVGSLISLIVGRSKGNNRLRSFGLGGIWAFGGMLLLGLLAFGACFIALSGFRQ